MSTRFLALLTLLLLTTSPAHAYLDPASGSMLLQLILGGAAGALLFLKLMWRRLLHRFGVGSTTPSERDGNTTP